jgi:hypothetical protein
MAGSITGAEGLTSAGGGGGGGRAAGFGALGFELHIGGLLVFGRGVLGLELTTEQADEVTLAAMELQGIQVIPEPVADLRVPTLEELKEVQRDQGPGLLGRLNVRVSHRIHLR